VNKDEKKISLGVKQLVNDPWHNLAERYPIGKKTTGIVRNLTNFGVFVELEPGIDGLIHISDLSWTEKVNHPSEVVSRDQTIDVVVLAIDFENRRITLGHKQALPNPWEKYAVEYAKGKEVEATISRFTERGAFVKLPLGVEAFFPANEAERGGEMNQSYKGGEKLTLRVIEFDEADRSIIVSEKALHQTEQKVKKATKKAKKDEDVNGSLTLGEMSGMADLKKLMDKPNQ
jgi:small subunit ribosomal protein S1